MSVPLDWDEAAGRTIEVSVKRLTTRSAQGQLWVLDGGPGATGAGYEQDSFVAELHARGWDVYIPTHRGTGASTPLSCPEHGRGSTRLPAAGRVRSLRAMKIPPLRPP